ncbi:jg10718 [Pararge aegeria aegeria]|uniref:Jg10718 protein n=2 Tax=Pararge aegeria TaxID=116150 RepID=A0A8S4RGF8_9NEOP|nr:jg10718 [Pararge aegeria aegeria]
MTRGNQRDLARAKNQKKQQEMQKKKNANEKTGMSLSERKHRDAELMREKQRKKEEQSGTETPNQAVNLKLCMEHCFWWLNIMNNEFLTSVCLLEPKLFKC